MKKILKNPNTLHMDGVSGFLEDVIYRVTPFNNYVKFSKLYPNQENSRKYITFLKVDPDPDSDNLIPDFVADFKWDGDSIVVERGDYGQYWRTSILIDNIKIEENFR